ncbi:MAG: T9SS type A sorting domain-containing protein [Spirosomataceae bacterium]
MKNLLTLGTVLLWGAVNGYAQTTNCGVYSYDAMGNRISRGKFEITPINIGSSQSGIKPGTNVQKSAWKDQFLTADAGPLLEHSTQANPTIYHTEKTNKTAPRYWTIAIETCLSTNGAISYDMLVTKESNVQQSFNTIENNAAYLMYANRDNYTELYAQNHPYYGFFANNGSGGNLYDAGLPKGLYKVSIRYWDQKGLGATPTTRTPQGNQLAYQEYWFRIQSQNGIGTGAAKIAANLDPSGMTKGFAKVLPNPVTRTLTLSINGAAGQEVQLRLVDAEGRTWMEKNVVPTTDQHREEVDMSRQNTGVYFMQVVSSKQHAALKVLKISPD